MSKKTEDGAPILFVTPDGEVISPETVEYAYTRDGRKEVGKEFPNPVPVQAPFQVEPYEPIWETMRRMILDHAHRMVTADQDEEMDTPEEADDFDVGDDYDPQSPWEEHFEPTDPWPMSTAARQLEQRINEERNKSRVDQLKQELQALQEGKPWPPVRGGGGAEPPSGEPSEAS